jgi:2-polyprenyl-3-methyl-5-hydroxy-6-metoxy-1,4-benzoquinol methylase
MLRKISAYYERGAEDGRLAAGAGRLEFLRTWDVLTRVLPSAPAAVLDVGGATGVYAGPLARAGYRVHVVDPIAAHVSLAAPDASVDGVLLLGPLYHLADRADRLTVWREAARVARPDGVVVAATISRYASLLDGFVKSYLVDPDFLGVVRGDLANGEYRNPEHVTGWFTTAYFHHPSEPAAEAAEAGLDVDRVVAVEGPLWMVGTLGDFLADDERTRMTLDLLREVESEPSLFSASSHLLTVAHRPHHPPFC